MANPTKKTQDQRIAIIGGGPAGLMAAEVLSRAAVRVDVYDAMPSVGRKFLMAGKGGMNITHSEAFAVFLSRYGTHADALAGLLEDFSPTDLRAWLQDLGIATFVGSSGRVFPTDMKAAPLLRAWLRRLREAGVVFHTRHRWLGWADDNTTLVFANPHGEQAIAADAVVLALGGASWPQLGSTGQWQSALLQQNIPVLPFQPANCGFEVAWSEHFKSRYAGQAVKTVGVAVADKPSQLGEFVITETGVESGVVYFLSAPLREAINRDGYAWMHLDLCPDKNVAWLADRLKRPRGKLSTANYLRKTVGIEGVKAGLLRELAAPALTDPEQLAKAVKALPIKLCATRPIAEAISSAGGVPFAALDANLMAKTKPGLFCAGEMLDWEAPTGGYLLTACFASGRRAGLGVLAWLGLSS